MVSFFSSFLLRASDYRSGRFLALSTHFFFGLADFFPGHSQAVTQAMEADREGRRVEGEQIAADAPRTLSEQLLSIQARLRPAHRMLRRLHRASDSRCAKYYQPQHTQEGGL